VQDLFSVTGGIDPFFCGGAAQKNEMIFTGGKKIYPPAPEQCYVRQMSQSGLKLL